MGCYYTLCLNTYAFSLLFYKVYMKRENADSWNFGLEKEQILETYSAQLQKSWNSTEVSFRIYKIYWAKKVPEGGHPPSTRVGARPGGRACPPHSWTGSGPPLVLPLPNIFDIFQNWLPWSFRTFRVVQNRSLIFAPFPAQNSSCRHSPSWYVPCKLWEKRH